MHYACHFDYQDLAIELIKYNALLGMCNKFNKTALDMCQNELKQTILGIIFKLENRNYLTIGKFRIGANY